MGTEVHYKNSFTGYYSMRNANEDSNNSSWHLFNSLTNGHYYDGFTPRTVSDAYLGQDKDELKQKMLQHEAIFRNQVSELHRLYKRQRDMMEEVKRKEFHKHHISIDTSSSSSLMPPQKPYVDANRFPLGNSASIFGAEITHEYIEPEEAEHIADNQISEILSYPAKENGFATKNGVKSFLDDEGKKDGDRNTASNGLADLNEPVDGQDVDFLAPAAKPTRFSNLPFEVEEIGFLLVHVNQVSAFTLLPH
ncbi:hypothetical protein M8C21_032269 [Ambrosia artemisiifolia]|uniref:Uncharacterized protein n=1 Tax=Ambrosia artemisiifolia TaxID=4212 RepID=A0AAD5D3G0_AMBAR|nr:hypothetical protein M8C21_032269 [Ambrosia artemisiifolia]